MSSSGHITGSDTWGKNELSFFPSFSGQITALLLSVMILICTEMPALKGSVLAFYKYITAGPISPYVLYIHTVFLTEQPHAKEEDILLHMYIFAFLKIFLCSNHRIC